LHLALDATISLVSGVPTAKLSEDKARSQVQLGNEGKINFPRHVILGAAKDQPKAGLKARSDRYLMALFSAGA
jgi:hypothetical protein